MAATLRSLAFGATLVDKVLTPDPVGSSNAKYILIALTTAMTTDIVISISVIHYCYTKKESDSSQQNRRLISRLLIHFIKTGAIPCLFATTILVLYVVCGNVSFAVSAAQCLGRVYTSTMLFTLLFRDRVRKDRSLYPSAINISLNIGGPSTLTVPPDIVSSPLVFATPPQDKTSFSSEQLDAV
ncbi:hypothetical protein CVT24_011343 [Panaeolus cyanescens]|uniref:DUF6534 domain-containing protein n=1 Tax=Panaeolus cyanescens TaxID=181874 RepID=A0A409YGJ0_9AGAR|nr:hypothetical protein CVT24_011343 [Panaeolus cyanescens]